MPPPRPALTHFLCLPLVTPASRGQLSRSLDDFRADVTGAASFGLPEDAVRPLGTLHLTLGVMSLAQKDDLQRAVDVLRTLKPREIRSGVKPPSMPGAAREAPLEQQQAQQREQGREREQEQSLAPAPLVITLRGLHTMQTPAKASVLYAPPADPDGTLQAFCERLRAPFREAGLMPEEGRPLLLHATVVNTIYVRGGGRGGPGRRKGAKGGGNRLTVDARGILDRYDDYVWAEGLRLEKVAICQMGAKKSADGEDAAYVVEAEVDI
ncbi:uncharacterized protein E0L32_008016 [Thyridium curvatum]|uniref:A-kinase anchor protein 7-like phosphoesterase domain-containing protein n=1 Tax=Thyridium curvatum TaxID=1093900 RepID=A0A507B133_9PEZI|nr:uncharacterized protein E0L32_008016 [Thyridium curvatum]TPX10979.1 hypothetical protein E0L32_008016 [Thyridium curvatum]